MNNLGIYNLKKEIHQINRFKFNLILSLSYSIICFLFITFFLTVFSFSYVTSSSMEDTLNKKDLLFCNKLSYILKNEPKRFDIINFYCPENNEIFVKRIIGLPNDKIDIKDGIVYINSEKIEENYILPDNYNTKETIVVPSNEYFVLGDNRANSFDSRYWEYKFVKKENILNKVILSFSKDRFKFLI